MFNALVLNKEEDQKATGEIQEIDISQLPEGDVLVKVDYSTINYKDSLAITSSSPIIKSFPMVPGIDFAGTVEESTNSNFNEGDNVILNGFGVGEKYWGGLAQKARVNGDWLVHMPKEFTPKQAMAIGTAGYTSMLCVMALENNGITPDKGEILVTGATGGVGSVAISLLSKLGYNICASSGREEHSEYLKSLGASNIINRNELSEKGRPLNKERWAGAIDSVGSHTLANICASLKYGGTVAACGLAQGYDLPSTVMPFILRGITLAGVDSVYCPLKDRITAWDRLASDLNIDQLNDMISTIPLSEVVDTTHNMLAGKTHGRIIVDVNS
ncbi:MAG: MDR family oxidoreductase [Alphaproteobacteria bacterium]|tara:strand:+ start:92 stop:1078 length:987 start_codon:yes stop_codon:yes gene_type:complete